MISQFRDATARAIQANPTDVSFLKNGTVVTETVRLSHEAASVPANSAGPVGLSTSFSMYLLTEFDSAISENDLLVENGNAWKVNVIDQLKACGEVYGHRATLAKVELLGDKEITAFSIGEAIGIIAGSDITVTVSAGTDITALIPNVEISGDGIAPVGAQDFTMPVVYTVRAQDLTNRSYNVMVVEE